jgi:hypothetical protein
MTVSSLAPGTDGLLTFAMLRAPFCTFMAHFLLLFGAMIEIA